MMLPATAGRRPHGRLRTCRSVDRMTRNPIVSTWRSLSPALLIAAMLALIVGFAVAELSA